MENIKRPILIPYDFTPVGMSAIEYAIKITKIIERSIILLHIVKKDEEINDATEKLDNICQEVFNKHKIKLEPVVKKGSIFSDIGETADEIHAEMVIMGTHGIHGMQKLFGSWALKVIVTSRAPFIVIQAPPEHDRFENVLFPIDFHKENKEKIKYLGYLYQLFKAKIHILQSSAHDSGFKKGVISNTHFTKKYLDSYQIDYEITHAKGKIDFAKETIEFAHEIEADLILIMTTKNINIADYVLGAHEQYIISNSFKIPVMCINPRPGRIGGGFSATGG